MRMIFKVILVALAVMAAMMFIKNQQVPKNLGVKEGKLSEVPDTPNGVSTQTTVIEKQVSPLAYKESLEASKEKIKKAIDGYGGGEIIKEESNYLYVVFTTGTMQYKDDAEFYFDDANQLIHFRSASRVGKSDMGLNRKRYETLSNMYLLK